MRIIKQGVLPEEKLYRGTCSSCRAEVEFKRGEGQSSVFRNETAIFIKCPTDGCHSSINGSPVPPPSTGYLDR